MGVAVGEVFFFFGEGDAEGLGSGVSSGVALGELFGFGFVDGLGDADVFFFVEVDFLWCLRGVGVGVGSKIFLIFSPNDSSAARISIGHAQSSAHKIDNPPAGFMRSET